MAEINKIYKIIWQNGILSFTLNYLVSNIGLILIGSIGILAICFLLGLLLKFILLRQRVKKQYAVLEVKPLAVTEQSEYTTQQLFTLIHSLAKQRPFIDRILNNNKYYALEIVSTKKEGIRYLIRVNGEDAELLKRSLLSYLPGVSVKETTDYLLKADLDNKLSSVTSFKLANHFAYPLKKQMLLEEHDPMAYITGNMTKLDAGNLAVFQVVLSPLNKKFVSDIRRITNLIYSNSDLRNSINNPGKDSVFSALVKGLFFVLTNILTLPVGVLVFIFSGGQEGPFLSLQIKSIRQKTINIYQQEQEKLIKEKFDQPLFNASLRLLVAGHNKSEISRRKRGFISSLASFNNSEYQSIIPFEIIRLNFAEKVKLFFFRQRLLGIFNRLILSASEMADIYHLPFTSTTKTEDIVKQHCRQLPSPVSLKKAADLDVVFAENLYGGIKTPIGLTQDERRRHMYILGATGTGKSTLLLSMIFQDIKNGKGLCVIDPHGDLIDKILLQIPEERIKDVIYFNPDDIGYPVGINLLELTPGLNSEDSLREKEFITESIISLFHKLYPDKFSGPRMEYILRNTIHTAFIIPGATLFTVYKLLINNRFRKSVIGGLTDENLKDFWKYEFNKAGDYQKVTMISPITNKIGRFLFSAPAKRVLEQEKSSINFDDILDKGKILLCNLSKGKIGEDSSEVFGILIMTRIQLAALKRARVPMENRKDFYLYVDEFQNFATPAFAQILSEARKYRLNAVLAHQTTSQLEDKSLVNITLANTGTIICFRTANPEDEKLILPQFMPYVNQGEIANLPSFNFYIKINALNPEEPFSGVTILPDITEDSGRAGEVIETSRKRYAIAYGKTKSTEVEAVKKNKRGSKKLAALP